MTVPAESTSDVRANLFNLYIDDSDVNPMFAGFSYAINSKSFPIQPKNRPDPVADFEFSREVTGTILIEQADHKIRRFFNELAATGESSIAAVGSIVPRHTLRIQDPTDTDHSDDLFFHSVRFLNYREDYPSGETGKLVPAVDFVAYSLSDGSADDGKILTIGKAFAE